MGDIYCAKCGEPWDSYSLQPGIYNSGEGDLTREEAQGILKGVGCPSCKFGTQCPQCNGRGKTISCRACRDSGRIYVWSPQNTASGFQAGRVYSGYRPDVREISEDVLRNFPPVWTDAHLSLDGIVRTGHIACPDCTPDLSQAGESCRFCRGTGIPIPDEDLEIEAARSECDNSDEDPMVILQRRRLA